MKNPVMQLAMLQGQSGPDHRRVQCDQQMIEVSRSRRLLFAHSIIWATLSSRSLASHCADRSGSGAKQLRSQYIFGIATLFIKGRRLRSHRSNLGCLRCPSPVRLC